MDRAVRGKCVLGTQGCNVYHMPADHERGKASQTLLAGQLRQGCIIDPGVGRVCELGTSGCAINHEPPRIDSKLVQELETRMKSITDKMTKMCALDKSRSGIQLEPEDVATLNRIESAKERIIKGFAR